MSHHHEMRMQAAGAQTHQSEMRIMKRSYAGYGSRWRRSLRGKRYFFNGGLGILVRWTVALLLGAEMEGWQSQFGMQMYGSGEHSRKSVNSAGRLF